MSRINEKKKRKKKVSDEVSNHVKTANEKGQSRHLSGITAITSTQTTSFW